MAEKLKVAFVCTHNACRSQMAEAIARKLAADVFDAYSAGTQIKDAINPDAVRMVKKLYDVDMAEAQRPKTLAQLPPVDVVVTMGCGVQCPFLPCKHREDWGLDDPTGQPETVFEQTARNIEEKIRGLKQRIETGNL